MPGPVSPDVAREAFARAKFGQHERARTPVTDAEKLAAKMRTAADKAKAEQRSARDPLTEARRESERVTRQQSSEAINDVFSAPSTETTKGLDGVDRDGVGRKTQAEGAADTLDKFLQGYDTRNNALVNPIRSQINAAIQGEFGGSDMLDIVVGRGGTNAQREARLNAFLDRWAKDPEYRATVRELGKDIISNPPDMEAVNQRIEAATKAATEKATAFTTERTANSMAEAANRAEQARVEAELEDFKPEMRDSTGTITPGGSKWQEMRQNQADMRTHKPQYELDRRSIMDIVGPFGARVENDQLVFDADQRKAMEKAGVFTDAITQVGALRKSDYVVAKESYAALTADKAKLEGDSARLLNEREQITARLSRAQEADEAAKKELKDATIAKATTEQGYADKLQNVFKDAMKKRIDQEDAHLDVAASTRLDTDAGNEQNPAQKSLKNAKARFWGKTEINKKGEVVDKLDRGHIKSSLETLIEDDRIKTLEKFKVINPATGRAYTRREVEGLADPETVLGLIGTGPEAVVQQLMLSEINPATGATYTIEEVNREMNNNPEFYKAQQEEVLKELVKKGFATRQINKDMYEKISSNPEWGGEAFVRGLFESDEVKKAFEEAKKHHSWLANMTTEQLKKHPTMAWLAMILLFMPGLSTIVIPAGVAIGSYKLATSFGKKH